MGVQGENSGKEHQESVSTWPAMALALCVRCNYFRTLGCVEGLQLPMESLGGKPHLIWVNFSS